MTKITRGRASKVDLLPDSLKEELHKLLRDKSNTQLEVRDAINELIEEHGLDDSYKISRSGLNRYATSMAKVGTRIAEAREVSKQWVSNLGAEPEGEVSKILIEMVRTLAFDSVVKMSESDEAIDPKLIKELAVGVERLERAASESQKREQELRKIIAEEMAQKVDKVAKTKGFTKEMKQTIMQEILGINNEV